MALTPHGWASWLLTLYGVGVLAWSVRNARAVVRLRQLAPQRSALPQRPHATLQQQPPWSLAPPVLSAARW